LQIPLFRKEVDHGEKVRYMDKMIEVVVTKDGQKSTSAYLKDNKLFISCGPGTQGRAKILEDWYRSQAACVFKEKADRFQTEMGLRYGDRENAGPAPPPRETCRSTGNC
jgi:hypothetical protein